MGFQRQESFSENEAALPGRSQGITVRSATPKDSDLVFGLVKNLGEYLGAECRLKSSAADIKRGLEQGLEAIIAYFGEEAVGMAVYFEVFSTFAGKKHLYLEDLFVIPDGRGKGVGDTLMRELARTAAARGYSRIDWIVLRSNEAAQRFYSRLGANVVDDHMMYRLEGQALETLVR